MKNTTPTGGSRYNYIWFSLWCHLGQLGNQSNQRNWVIVALWFWIPGISMWWTCLLLYYRGQDGSSIFVCIFNLHGQVIMRFRWYNSRLHIIHPCSSWFHWFLCRESELTWSFARERERECLLKYPSLRIPFAQWMLILQYNKYTWPYQGFSQLNLSFFLSHPYVHKLGNAWLQESQAGLERSHEEVRGWWGVKDEKSAKITSKFLETWPGGTS